MAAVESGASNVMVMASIQDLQEFAEFLLERQKQNYDKANLADREQLHPFDYWQKMYGFDRSTLWRWEQEGRIKPTRMGSRLYFKQSDFENISKNERRGQR